MLVIVLALVTNIIYIVGYVIATAAVRQMPPLRIRRPVHLAITLFRSPLWAASLAVELSGLVCQVVVLSRVPLVVAELLFLAAIPVLLGMAHVFLGERVSRREGIAIGLIMVSVAVAALSLTHGEGDGPIRIGFPVLAALTAGTAIVGNLVFALNDSTGTGQRRTPKAGVAYGVSVGLTFGVMGLQSKALAQAYAHEPGAGLMRVAAQSPYPVMILATGTLGIGGLMVALQRCRASVVLTVVLVVSNWLLLVAGTVVFNSQLPHSALRLALRVTGLVMIVALLTLFPHNDPTLAGFEPSVRPPARHQRSRRQFGAPAVRISPIHHTSQHPRNP